MQSINLIQVTPEELQQKIVDGVKACLTEMAKHFYPKQENELLTRQEAAKKLKISLSTLNNWVGKGMLTSYGIGGRVYLKNSDIEQALVELNPDSHDR